ncbi:MAG: geranylgeranyl reductase family protein [Chryseolinea sp.]
MKFDFDVLIIGAGPAGCAAAIELGKTSLSIAVFDKASFPRDKTCGDALSVDVINQLGKLSPELEKDFFSMSTKISSKGVSIFAPNGKHIDIPFTHNHEQRSGFICKRIDFDDLLVQFTIKQKNVTVFQDTEVKEVHTQTSGVTAVTSKGIFNGKIIIAADGAHSIVRKKFNGSKIDRYHHSAGLRRYYKGITGFNPGNYIELYFFKDILPGYLWIFPLPNGEANIGIGMLSVEVANRKVNLSKKFESLIYNHPLLAERFKNARPVETAKGHGLPLGWTKRKISGNKFLLTGDAASLIDPFSGEGIGNAIRSGRVAAEHIRKCIASEDFSAAFNKKYDEEIYRRVGKEFAIGNTMLRLCRYTWLFNTIVNKANKNDNLHRVLIDSLANPEKKKWLVQPSFYFNLFFRS